MRVHTTTDPAVEPVSLNEAKIRLRYALTVGDAYSYDEIDSTLLSAIKDARIIVENDTDRALITQTREYYLDKWPDSDYITIPYPPLQSATVTYRLVDDSGYDNAITLDTDTVTEPGRLVLKPGKSWPDGKLYPDRPIKIVFICGYGDAPEDVPEPLRNAILLKVADADAFRGSLIAGVNVSVIPGRYDSLINHFRIYTRFK